MKLTLTRESVFGTFPWPQFENLEGRVPRVPNSKITWIRVTRPSAAAREVRRVRAEALRDLKGGLRTLYCLLELPSANLLKGTHAALERQLFRAMN